MRNIFVWLSFALSALLVGCETQPIQRDPYEGFYPALDQVSVQCDARMEPSVISELTGKLPIMSTDKRTFIMMANQTFAAESEKLALVRYMALREKCREQFLEVHDRFGFSGVSSLWRSSYGSSNGIYADLYNGSITYGDANKQIERVVSATIQAVQEYMRAVDAQQMQLAEQQRQNAILMMQQWNAQRPTYTPNPNPTTTCRTSRIGTQLKTVCN